MRFLFFVRDITDCGGIQKTTCNLVNSIISRDNHEIIVVSLYHKNKEPFFEIDSNVKLVSLYEHTINLRKNGIDIKIKLSRILQVIEFDYLIVQGTEYSNYIPRKAWNKKVIVCEHGYFGFGHLLGLHWRGVRKALKKATAIVTLTSLDEEEFKNHRINSNTIICHIYNAYEKIDQIPGNYNIDSKTIVSCGSLVKLKGFHRVIQAAKIVIETHPDWIWEIFGDGPLREKLEAMINENGLENNVILKGFETKKQLIFEGKSFVVSTSDFEGFGMVLIEAMQFGLPVISFDIKYGPKEIIEHQRCGELIPAYNVEELARTVNQLIDNPVVRKQYSEYTYKALEKFSPEKILEQWMELFKDLSNH